MRGTPPSKQWTPTPPAALRARPQARPAGAPRSPSAGARLRPMPHDQAISRSVLAEQVKDRILQDILSGRYPSHYRIVETRVAKELGTSQAPVREALRGLEALGLIEILPFRGARVRRPSADEMRDAYLVRTELEVLGARLGVPKMTDSDLTDLDGLYERMRKAAGKKDRHAVAVADTGFHQRLLSMSGN